MSYYPPPAQYPSQQPPHPQPYPPQSAHGSSPYPPPQSPYPQQFPPGQASYPPQQYPPSQSPYPPPMNPAYNQQPPYGAPPNQQPPYGAPPHQQPPYGAPQYGQQPQYGAPPPQQYSGPPAPPSLGYDPHQVVNIDTSRDVEALHKSMKGFGTDEKAMTAVLAKVPDPLIMACIRRSYSQRFMKDLLKAVDSEVSGYFGETCLALVRGPLEQDAWVLHDALVGAGTKESALDDVLLGRSNADMRAIKAEYNRIYRRSLEADVKGDLSMKTETLFVMVLSGTRQEESAPVMPQQIDADVTEVHRATVGVKLGADAVTVCQIFSSRSNGQLRAISHAYEQKYRTPLAKIIEKEFSGHMESALLRMLHVAEDPAMADAQSLEDSMKGIGTKDRLLLNRLVRLHWKGRDHKQQVKGAYKHRFKKELVGRVEGETSGDFKRILVALLA